jgi:hypothetical protein
MLTRRSAMPPCSEVEAAGDARRPADSSPRAAAGSGRERGERGEELAHGLAAVSLGPPDRPGPSPAGGGGEEEGGDGAGAVREFLQRQGLGQYAQLLLDEG